MIIQHNISAINAHRTMGINNSGTSKNLEKLSSGFKINRAGDDAAGLAISEKMRGQIRGLAMAEQNTQNGVSLIQTAEGGLNETHAILQRMRELAVQSSNGTYQDEDREQITLEFNALKSEVDRIAESTHYNGIKLLNGNLSNEKVAEGVNDAYAMLMGSEISMAANKVAGDKIELDVGTYTAAVNTERTTTISQNTPAAAGEKVSFTFNGKTYTTAELKAGDNQDKVAAAMAEAIMRDDSYKGADFTVSATGATLVFTATDGGAGTIDAYEVKDLTVLGANGGAAVGKFSAATATTKTGEDAKLVGAEIDGDDTGVTATFDSKTNSFNIKNANGTISITVDADKVATDATLTLEVSQGNKLTFQIGANGGDDQRVNLSVGNMDSNSIGYKIGDKLSDGSVATDNVMLASASIGDIDSANKAIDIIHSATNMVSGQRAELGALQNRLEHTLNNLGVTKENLTAAESTIRDVDMAKEMMEFTKNNILVQASQAMLAQANQLPQGVLQLLR